MKKALYIFSGVIAIFALALVLSRPVPQAIGSVQIANEYHSTTTPYVMTAPQVVDSDTGVLGSVVITGANTGVITLYDATTTDKTKRNNTATTTLASFPASAAAGTYTFDVAYYSGLIVEVTNGSAPTTTITYRP